MPGRNHDAVAIRGSPNGCASERSSGHLGSNDCALFGGSGVFGASPNDRALFGGPGVFGASPVGL